MPTTARLLSWLRQTTTVQGLAVLAATAAMQVAGGVPWPIVLAGAVAALVLLILPGQGDLAGKIGTVAADVALLAATRGSKAAVGKLTADSVALAQGLAPATPTIPVSAVGDHLG